MKKLTFVFITSLHFMLLFNLTVNSQTTEELFSQEGLSLSAFHNSIFPWESFSKSYTYVEKDTLCGENVLVYNHNQIEEKLYLQIENKKVYRTWSNCFKDLLYDFGIEVGDTVSSEFFSSLVLVDKYPVELLNGETRTRFDFEFPGGGGRTSWIEGIGNIYYGLYYTPDIEGGDIFICAKQGDELLWINEFADDIDEATWIDDFGLGFYEFCDSLSCARPVVQFDTEIDGFELKTENKSLFANAYEWDFGDGSTSNEVNPSHIYQQAGCYNISLTVYNNCFSNGSSSSQANIPVCLSNFRDIKSTFEFLNNFSLRWYSESLMFVFKGDDLYRSVDDGQTWTYLPIPSAGEDITRFIRDFEMFDDLNGVISCGHYGASGEQKSILVTHDGGISWEEKVPGSYFTGSLELGANGEVWVIPKSGVYRDYCHRSLDYGDTWEEVKYPDAYLFSNIQNVQNVVLIANAYIIISSEGDYYIAKSYDKGTSWEHTLLPDDIKTINFIDPFTGYGFGSEGIYKSVDGGDNWTLINSEIVAASFDFLNEDTAWVSDITGPLYYTTDGFQTYSIFNCQDEPLRNIVSISAEKILGVSNNQLLVNSRQVIGSCTIDEDGDGFSLEEDCNDENPDINPGATEIPGNGIDENCDGIDAIVSACTTPPQTGSFNCEE